MTRIFISYASHDSEFADRYYHALLARDHTVWMDRAELKGGHEWVHIIQERILWSETMVVLWSANALKSTWVEMEMTYAHTLKKKIIPVRIDDTAPQEHMIINARQVIDGREATAEQVVTQIEESIASDNRRPITTHMAPIETPPPMPAPPVPPAPRRSWRWLAGGLVALLVVAAAVVLAFNGMNAAPPSTAAPTLTSPPLPTLAPNALTQPATLDLLNAWRASSGLPSLNSHPALQAVAEQHLSYLRSLPLPELESTNMFRNADGQDAIFMASEAGYTGEATMVVVTTDDQYTLQNLLDELDGLQDYTDAGFEQVRSIATNKLYLVLVLGRAST